MWGMRPWIFAGIFLQTKVFLAIMSSEALVEFGEWLCEEVLKAVPHQHFVFSITKILRRYFLYDRKLLSDLSRCGWESLKVFFQEVVPKKGTVPGATVAKLKWKQKSRSAGFFRKNSIFLILISEFKCKTWRSYGPFRVARSRWSPRYSSRLGCWFNGPTPKKAFWVSDQ